MSGQSTYRAGIGGWWDRTDQRVPHPGAQAHSVRRDRGHLRPRPVEGGGLGQAFGLPVRTSLAELRAAGADVIHVLTPPHTHAAIATAALEAGCHAFVEKPLATDPEDCTRLAALAKARACTWASRTRCCTTRRSARASRRRARARWATSWRSTSCAARCTRLYAGGPLPPQYRTAGYPFRDLGIHALYIIEAFLGPIEKVDAVFREGSGDGNLVYNDWRAVARCARGLGQVQLSFGVRPLQHQVIIQGTKGVLRLDLFLMFQAKRKALPLPKPAERIVNALTDSIQPLIDVPRNVVAFARKQIRPVPRAAGAGHRVLRGAGRGHAAARPRRGRRACRAASRRRSRAGRRPGGRGARKKFPLAASVPFLVTGASGGLGSALVERLRAEGHKVRVMVRRLPAAPTEGLEYARGDLGDAEAVDRAVRGARCVIHVGAAMKGSWQDHQGGTIEGTRNVLAACRKHGVEKLVHVSSLSVIDWAGRRRARPSTRARRSRAGPRSAARTRRPSSRPRSSCRAEAARGLPAVIIRPGQIFGRRIPLMTAAVARRGRAARARARRRRDAAAARLHRRRRRRADARAKSKLKAARSSRSSTPSPGRRTRSSPR
jgi:predicted dehydrogenase/uncharacterized protein YbjT (DUF2867 family)